MSRTNHTNSPQRKRVHTRDGTQSRTPLLLEQTQRSFVSKNHRISRNTETWALLDDGRRSWAFGRSRFARSSTRVQTPEHHPKLSKNPILQIWVSKEFTTSGDFITVENLNSDVPNVVTDWLSNFSTSWREMKSGVNIVDRSLTWVLGSFRFW